jgi:hypothetical protein
MVATFKITDMPVASTVSPTADYFPLWQGGAQKCATAAVIGTGITSINKMAITAPATSSTLAIADGKTFTVNQTLTLTGTAGTTMTFPATSDTMGGLGTAQTWSAANTFSSNVIGSKSITAAANAGAFSYGTLPYTGIDIVFSGNAGVDNYTQLIVSNSNATGTASANVIVSNDSGTDSAYYGAFGINSSAFTSGGVVLNMPNSTYLSCISGDLAIGTIDAHAVHLGAGANWTTDAITISSSNVPSIMSGNLVTSAAQAANGQLCQVLSLTELTTIAAAATTSTTIQLPANAIIFAVSTRVVTVIPTATSFSVGITGTPLKFGASGTISVAAGTTDVGTLAGASYNATAQTVLLTMNGGTPAANTGQVRTTIHYMLITAPTS